MTQRLASLAVLTLVTAVLGTLFYQVLAPFLLPMFLAAMMAVISRPLQQWLHQRFPRWRSLVAGVTTLSIVTIVLVPVMIAVLLGANELLRATRDLDSGAVKQSMAESWQNYALPRLAQLEKLGIDTSSVVAAPQALAEEIPKWGQAIGQRTLSIAADGVSAAVSMLVAIGIFLVALFYFVADGPHMLAGVSDLIPVPHEHQKRLFDQFSKSVRSVVLATFAAAIVQGLATSIAIQFTGAGNFFLFFMVATIAALIPFVGTIVAWGPVVVWLATTGHRSAAIGLALYGFLIVSTVDNVVRTYVLQSDAALHPLLALVSVLGGLQVIGLWGVFIGPIIASCFYVALQVFNQELRSQSSPVQPGSPPGSPPGPGIGINQSAEGLVNVVASITAPPASMPDGAPKLAGKGAV